MADPITILGAVAASSQLIEQGFKITKFILQVYSDIQNAPELVSSRFRQIEQLIAVSKIIRQIPALQSREVLDVLSSCRDKSTIVQSKLEQLTLRAEDSRWHKLQNVLATLLQKKDLMALFDDLEREKSTLILCLQTLQPSILSRIGDEVHEVEKVLSQFAQHLAMISKELPHLADEVGAVHEISFGISEKIGAIHDTMLPDLMRRLSIHQQTLQNKRVRLDGTYGIPNRQSRIFLGREDVLQQLVRAVPIPGASVPRIVVIRGIGGQGKTQLVLRFCSQAIEKKIFSAIFWVDASSESSTKKCFESFYERISGDKHGFMELDSKIEFVVSALSSSELFWLLVFDNYDDPILFDSIQDFFPETGRGVIVITTRRAETTTLADDDWFIELPGLRPVDGTTLLLKHCQIKPSEKANGEALVIVERLGYHALAIAQAGTYINSRRIRLNQFLDHFNRRKEIILQQTPHMSQYRRKLNEAEKDTSLSVFTTWELSFQHLEIHDTDGAKSRILTLLAFFDCKDVSENLLKGCCDSGQLSPAALEILGRCVHKVSHNETVDMDDSHDEPNGSDECEEGDVSDGDQEYKSGNREPGKEEEKEVKEEVKEEEDEESDEDGEDEEDEEYGQYLWDSDLFGDILNDLRQLSLIEIFNTSDDECYHVVLHPLVSDWIKLRIKDPTTRYKYFLLSTEILCKRINTTSSSRNATVGYSLSSAGRREVVANLNTVQQNFQELVDLQDSKFYIHYGRIVRDFQRFFDFLFDIGRYREALQWCRLVVRLCREIAGDRSRILLSYSIDLAFMLLSFGEYDEARDVAREVLADEEPTLYPFMIIQAQDIIASSLSRQGQYDEAERIYRDVIENVRELPSKPAFGTLMNNFGYVLHEAGKYEAAEQVKGEAREFQRLRFGEFHQLSIEADNNYVMILKDLGRTEEAEKIAMDVLQRSQTTLGSEHPTTIEIVDTLAQVYFTQGRSLEAKELWKQALAWREISFGLKHPKTIESQTLMDELNGYKGAGSQE